MLNEIGSVDKIPEFIEGVKNRYGFYYFCTSSRSCNPSLRVLALLMIISCTVISRKRKMSGFGHRVYKNYDPRAKVIKRLAEEVFSIVGRDPLIEVGISVFLLNFLLTLDVCGTSDRFVFLFACAHLWLYFVSSKVCEPHSLVCLTRYPAFLSIRVMR